MNLKHESIEALQRNIKDIVYKYLDNNQYNIFFFGSRVQEKGDERSDIDIGIKGSKPIPVNVFETIKDKIEEIPTLYTIDIVDFQKVSPEFKSVALKKIIPW
jgi:uncharacterized protein